MAGRPGAGLAGAAQQAVDHSRQAPAARAATAAAHQLAPQEARACPLPRPRPPCGSAPLARRAAGRRRPPASRPSASAHGLVRLRPQAPAGCGRCPLEPAGTRLQPGLRAARCQRPLALPARPRHPRRRPGRRGVRARQRGAPGACAEPAAADAAAPPLPSATRAHPTGTAVTGPSMARRSEALLHFRQATAPKCAGLGMRR
mmetsp:Transcript_108715/g.340122  ORF Transcript_108715/g.340122 Transcript_108715/m.340122 type:complete len:202 (+) Transcript_108715:1061-1666(+)